VSAGAWLAAGLAAAVALLALGAPASGSGVGGALNGRIEFGDNTGRLFAVDSHGGDAVPLLGTTSNGFAAAGSPDGRSFAYASGIHLYVVDVDGVVHDVTGPVFAGLGTSYQVATPAWSPDGRTLVFAGRRWDTPTISNIYTIGVDGSGFAAVTFAGGATAPAWSPDGTTIAYLSGGRILAVNPDSTNTRALTPNVPAGVSYFSVDWSPDGASLAASRSQAHGKADVALLAADGSGAERILTASDGRSDGAPTWSPDGTKIAFVSTCPSDPCGDRSHLFVMDADGSHRVDITPAGMLVTSPDWQALPTSAPARFGKAATGAISAAPGAGFNFGSPYLLSQPARATAISFYAAGGAADQRFVPVIYRFANGKPTTLAVQGAEVTVAANQPAGWVTSAVPATPLAAGNYVLGLLSGPADRGASVFFDSLPDSGLYGQSPYPTPPAQFGTFRSDQQLSVYADLSPVAPVSTHPPAVEGTLRFGSTLTADPGGWNTAPNGFTYLWQRCDGAGARCVPVGSGPTYLVGALDVAKTIRVQATATNGAGSVGALSPAAGPVGAGDPFTPPGFDSVATDASGGDCDDCTITPGSGGGFQATVGAGIDSRDTAYALRTFGGTGGVTDTVTVSDSIMLAAGTAPSANVSILQVRDAGDLLVYELYATPDRVLHLWSPAGALTEQALNLSTGVAVPLDDGTTAPLHVEVRARANDGLTIVVDGVQTNSLAGFLRAASTAPNQQRLRVGIDHYDSPSAFDGIAVVHRDVGVSIGTTSVAPANSVLPGQSGQLLAGEALTAYAGVWTGSPASFAYSWQRCDGSGAVCVEVGTASTYTLTPVDGAKTIRLRVTASNSAGSATATSDPSGPVNVRTYSPPAGFTEIVSDEAGGDCDDCTVTPVPDGFQATVGAGIDSRDTAYALTHLGGATTISDELLVAATTTPSANVSVLQVRDTADALVYELYLDSGRVLHLWSPAGGLRADPINLSTGVAVPIQNGSAAPLRVTVGAAANNSLTITVNGDETNRLTGLAGAATGDPDRLRVGIDHYDSPSAFDTLGVIHRNVSWS
jgi:hypothetical protein